MINKLIGLIRFGRCYITLDAINETGMTEPFFNHFLAIRG